MIIIELVLVIKNKFQQKRSILVLIMMIITSFSVFYNTFITNVTEGKDILVAQREGIANCMTTITFNENGKYYKQNVCFGISETVGAYKMKNDTIWFKDDEDNKEDKLKFALLKSNELVLHYKTDDKRPLKMFVIFNDL